MTHLGEFPLAEGGSVLVEVTEYAAGPVTRGLKGAEITERARQFFEEAVGRIQPAVQGVIAQSRSLTETPDEVHIEFGLDLHAEAGAFIAAVSSTANFTVALTWRRTAQGANGRSIEPASP
jgi:Trypsin-co-occurring domain 1